MQPTRPIALKRLDRALSEVLSEECRPDDTFSYSELRRKLELISQEKRFILVMYLLQEPSSRTAYEIAEAIKDHKNNVIRNLHVLVSERLALPSRDETTGIIRFRINQDLMQRLSELLKPAQSRGS
jgi:hypothetical protein